MIKTKYVLLILLLIMVHNVHTKEEKGEEKIPQGEECVFDHTVTPSYSSEATFYIIPHDLKYNLRGYRPIDMGITKIDQFSFSERYHNKIQNLGSNGSAAQPIFYTLPKHIGITSGFHAYDMYFLNIHKTKYYYTPSYYSYFNLVFARLYNFHFDACYSKNIIKNWNIGIHFQSFMSGNEWPKVDDDDKIVSNYPHIHIFTHFKTKSTRYHIFSSFSHEKHKIKETGGIRRVNDKEPIKRSTDLLHGEEIKNNLLESNTLQERSNKETKETFVLNKDARKQFHLYHQFICIPQLHLYHELTWKNQFNIFNIIDNRSGKKIPDIGNINRQKKEILEFLGCQDLQDEENIKHITNIKRLGNEIGVKGDVQKLFYALYYRREHVDFLYQGPQQKQKDNELKKKENRENYAGLKLRYAVEQNSGAFYCNIESLLNTTCYKIKGGYRGKVATLSYKQVCSLPSLLVQEYHNRKFQREWKHKNFKFPIARELKWGLYIPLPYVSLKPGLSFIRINHHISFKEDPRFFYDPNQLNLQKPERHVLKNNCITKPTQEKEPINILSLYADINFTLFSYFYIDYHSMFTIADALFEYSLPQELHNTRVYYAAKLYHNKLDIECGCNVHFKTYYLGYFYDVVTQQFYKQQMPCKKCKEPISLVQGEPIIDFFVNFRIKNFKAFWKIANISEFFKPKNKEGYFVTPFYPGQRQSFDIGIYWSFFD